jgi:acyl-coenzyme A thioesterase PaaI-like protein
LDVVLVKWGILTGGVIAVKCPSLAGVIANTHPLAGADVNGNPALAGVFANANHSRW